MAVILQLYDFNRGTNDTDYRQGDLVAVVEDYATPAGQPVNPDMTAWLPPSSPYWLVRVEGVTKGQIEEIIAPETNADGSIKNKRTYSFRQNRVPSAYLQHILTYRFLGFGVQPYLTKYAATPGMSTDVALQWSEVSTWIRNKNNQQAAPLKTA